MSLDYKKTELIYRPVSIKELDQIVCATKEKLTFVAGTTDLMVNNKTWQEKNHIVDLTTIPELSWEISTTKEGIRIGSALPMSEIINHHLIKEKLPILIETLKQIGSEQIQNRATLGGNIANASPAADSLPVLNVLDAQLWIGPKKSSEFEKIHIAEIMSGPGETILKANQYIAFIFIPFPKKENMFWYFRKVGQRQALAISKLSLAILGNLKEGKIENIRISAGAVTAQVNRAIKTESVLINQKLKKKIIEKARMQLENEIQPITDIRSNVEYRKGICGELLREALYNQL